MRRGAPQPARPPGTLPQPLRFRTPPSPRPQDRALWLLQAGAPGVDDVAPPTLPGGCDVCVVGGGFTGLWTAIEIKRAEPSTAVVLIEAGVCGGAASGRNGGFVMTAWSKYGALERLCGRDGALRYARAAERAVGDIGAFCTIHAVDAEFHDRGWVWAATNAAQLDGWKYTIDQLAAAGVEPYVLLDRDEVAERAASPVHLAGVFEKVPATVHPGKLARGLADVARGLGVTIVEGCALRELQTGGAPVLTTSHGTLRADHVVLAISAWAAGLPAARKSLVVVASDVIATEPAPDRLDAIGWELGVSVSDSRRLVNYYRTTEDGRVVFGKGGGDIAVGARITNHFDRSESRAAAVVAQFRRTYPNLGDVPVHRHWRGAVDYSVTGVPFVGPLPGSPQVLVAAGFSGNGVGPSHVAGRAMSQMVRGHEPEDLPEGLRVPRDGRMPPEPIRYLAGRVVREAVRRKEDAEDLGQTPNGVLRGIASLDPTSFTDKGPSKDGSSAGR
jgi:glycine/D-amino acid oxidase-like deaminating enzyme